MQSVLHMSTYLFHRHMFPMVIQADGNLRGKSKLSGEEKRLANTENQFSYLCNEMLFYTNLKKIGWSVNEGAEASLSAASSLPDVEKPLWLMRLWVGTDIIGARSWLVCLEKLQEISGAATFFVETQTVQTNIEL